jgi:hypothetical protein
MFGLASLLAPNAEASGSSLAPEDGALLGMWAKPKDGDWTKAGFQRRFNKLESLAGRTFDIGHYYYQFGAAFPSWRESWHRDNGRVGYISWDAKPSGQINNGEHDGTIRAAADRVKAFGDPLLIRYAWEMAEGVNHADAGTPAAFKAAWRRIVTTFGNRGATNAEFVWCPTAWAFHTGAAQQYYPGDDYVDWICADGYNWAPGQSGKPWREFGDIFDAFYAWASPHNKPLMVGEFGVQEGTPGRKANWFRNIPSTLQNEYPDIKAIVYFDSDKPYPWWLDTTASSVAGFKDMANSPYLTVGPGGGSAPPPPTTTTAPPETTTTTTPPPPPPLPPGADGIKWRGQNSTYANVPTHSVKIPRWFKPGDVMLMMLSMNDDDVAIKHPAGWKTIGTRSDESMKTRAWYRVVRSGDPGSTVKITLGTRRKATLTVAAYSGVDTADPLVAYKARAEDKVRARHMTPNLATGVDGAWAVSYFADKTSGTTNWQKPANQRVRVKTIGSGGGRITSLLTDSNGPLSRRDQAGKVTAIANTANSKATMWTFVLRPVR